MRATNGKINAVVDDLGDAGKEAEARQVDERQWSDRPLHGVPVTIKENVDQKVRDAQRRVAFYGSRGRCTRGTKFRRAGAIIIGA
jgi:Asp-tRNA(Asn)/Glu-tRNA(Gln) amidotransferase A subunit family amidase